VPTLAAFLFIYFLTRA